MNLRNLELKDLVQTDITSFLRINSQKIITSEIFKSLEKSSIKELQKIARYHKIKRRSKMDKKKLIQHILLYKKTELSEIEWKKILGDEWVQLFDINCFINNKKSMIVGPMDSLKLILKVRNIENNYKVIKSQIEIEDIANEIIRKESYLVVNYNDYYYDFVLIGNAFQILGKKLRLNQNSNGFLLLNNPNKFSLIAPFSF